MPDGLGDNLVNGMSPEDWQKIFAMSGGMPSFVAEPSAAPATPQVMQPDLLATQLGQISVPPGYAINDAGEIFNKQTGEVLPVTRRPGVLPITKDPSTGELQPAMPVVADIAGFMGGGSVPVKGAEAVLGAGAVRRTAKAAEEAPYIYHVSREEASPAIQQGGLQKGTYFSSADPGVTDVKLQQQFPTYRTRRGENVIPDDNRGKADFLSTQPIPPAQIEILRGGKWEPVATTGSELASTITSPNVITSSRQTIEPLPWAAERYPEAGGFELLPKTRGLQPGESATYAAKVATPEEEAVKARTDVAMANIKAGAYEPYFDVSKRAPVDPTGYPEYSPTLAQKFSATKSGEKARASAEADVAGAEPKLIEAYRKGEQFPGAFGFYHMKQLEDEYIKQFGPELGRQKFLTQFVEPMAGTTSGNPPLGNYLISQYGMRPGVIIPEQGQMYHVPFPASGAAMGANNFRELVQQVIEGGGLRGGREGGIDWMGNPKKYNFGFNFLGTGGPTIDKQMMGLISRAGLDKPRTGGYGIWEQPVHDVAAKLGIDPITLQEVAWAGTKKAAEKPNVKTPYIPVPMIQNINTAIERTATVTGLRPDEVVRRMIRGDIPIYGYSPLPTGGWPTQENQ